ncbi:hypothetical protein GGS23DRAFT_560842, partial [Durotheca rogersii]|uniref:uncharacterized protein n=1 Tax=Durotheca rogersii TaxID=419775 RepID=UPI0022211A2A
PFSSNPFLLFFPPFPRSPLSLSFPLFWYFYLSLLARSFSEESYRGLLACSTLRLAPRFLVQRNNRCPLFFSGFFAWPGTSKNNRRVPAIYLAIGLWR